MEVVKQPHIESKIKSPAIKANKNKRTVAWRIITNGGVIPSFIFTQTMYFATHEDKIRC